VMTHLRNFPSHAVFLPMIDTSFFIIFPLLYSSVNCNKVINKATSLSLSVIAPKAPGISNPFSYLSPFSKGGLRGIFE
jgi:hypothetical protein